MNHQIEVAGKGLSETISAIKGFGSEPAEAPITGSHVQSYENLNFIRKNGDSHTNYKPNDRLSDDELSS